MQYNGLQVAQDRETPAQVERHAVFTWRYAYARAADTQKVGDPGQDYLAVRYSEHVFAFALCDGVSQSFFGDLAARFLGDGLIEWLWQDCPQTADEQTIRAALTDNLHVLSTRSTSLVQSHPLPEGIPTMLREVLEQKRAIGSETTFACGRIDAPNGDHPGGRIILAWMGDSRLRLWGPGGERTAELGQTFRTEQRWSTRRGPVNGEPNILTAPIEEEGRRQVLQLMAYSDGLPSVDNYQQSPSNEELNALISAAAEAAVSDDVSFLELWLERTPIQKQNDAMTIYEPSAAQDWATVIQAQPPYPMSVPQSQSQPQSQPQPQQSYQAPMINIPDLQPPVEGEGMRNNSLLLIMAIIAFILAGIVIVTVFIDGVY